MSNFQGVLQSEASRGEFLMGDVVTDISKLQKDDVVIIKAL